MFLEQTEGTNCFEIHIKSEDKYEETWGPIPHEDDLENKGLTHLGWLEKQKAKKEIESFKDLWNSWKSEFEED